MEGAAKTVEPTLTRNLSFDAVWWESILLVTNCVLPPSGAWLDWFLDISPGIALRFHPLLVSIIWNVGGTSIQYHDNRSKSFRGFRSNSWKNLPVKLRCSSSLLAGFKKNTVNSFINLNACETTMVWIYIIFFIHSFFLIFLFTFGWIILSSFPWCDYRRAMGLF